jgi:phosphatidylglycerophosphatase A
LRVTFRTLLDPVHVVAFGFGAGLAPRAPGTAGSVVGIVIAWWLLPLPLHVRAAIVLVAFAAGIWVCGESARRLNSHDHPGIVLDEIVAVLAATLVMAERSLLGLFLVFVLFRVFDIAKPWPIRDVDHRLGGGLGIMLDDLIAAFYAAVGLAVIRVLLPTI